MNIKSVLKLIEIKTLTAGFLPVLLGSVYSCYSFNRINLLYTATLAIAIALIQSATNMFNDYMDYQRGADGEDKADEKVLVSGELRSHQILKLVIGFFFIALIIGVAIASQTSWAILLVALAGAVVAFVYSFGAIPISYTPFGEVVSGVTMGIGITATVVFIQSGHFYIQSIFMAVPTAISIAYIMFTNNLCDLEKDKRAGRRTLPGLLGFNTAKIMWMLGCVLLILMTIILIICGIFPVWDAIVVLLIVNYRSMHDIWRFEEEQFQKNRMMGTIGKIGVQYHLLIMIGLVIADVAKLQ